MTTSGEWNLQPGRKTHLINKYPPYSTGQGLRLVPQTQLYVICLMSDKDDKILTLLNSVFLCIYVPVTALEELDIPVLFVPHVFLLPLTFVQLCL